MQVPEWHADNLSSPILLSVLLVVLYLLSLLSLSFQNSAVSPPDSVCAPSVSDVVALLLSLLLLMILYMMFMIWLSVLLYKE